MKKQNKEQATTKATPERKLALMKEWARKERDAMAEMEDQGWLLDGETADFEKLFAKYL